LRVDASLERRKDIEVKRIGVVLEIILLDEYADPDLDDLEVVRGGNRLEISLIEGVEGVGGVLEFQPSKLEVEGDGGCLRS